MRGAGRVGAVVVVLVLLHLVFRVALGIGDGAPDFFLIAVLLIGREGGVLWGAVMGFGMGLMEDALSMLAFGANSIALTVSGIVGGVTRDLFVGDSRIFVPIFLFFGKWLRDLAYWVVAPAVTREPIVEAFFTRGPLLAAYTAALGVVAFAMAGRYGGTDA